jgi:hypothetical protein
MLVARLLIMGGITLVLVVAVGRALIECAVLCTALLGMIFLGGMMVAKVTHRMFLGAGGMLDHALVDGESPDSLDVHVFVNDTFVGGADGDVLVGCKLVTCGQVLGGCTLLSGVFHGSLNEWLRGLLEKGILKG